MEVQLLRVLRQGMQGVVAAKGALMPSKDERRKCEICGKYFWSADSSRKLCGDSSHEPYSFIRKSPKSIDYVEFWHSFSRFFKKEGHAIIDSYPVVSRWRQDLYYTIAGIQDFQRIEHGTMSFEYPANPLM